MNFYKTGYVIANRAPKIYFSTGRFNFVKYIFLKILINCQCLEKSLRDHVKLNAHQIFVCRCRMKYNYFNREPVVLNVIPKRF